jgi:hypothetical protein
LTPDLAVNTFRNIDRLFPTRTIKAGGKPSELPKTEKELGDPNTLQACTAFMSENDKSYRDWKANRGQTGTYVMSMERGCYRARWLNPIERTST